MPTHNPNELAQPDSPPFRRQYIASPYTAQDNPGLESIRAACAAIALAWVLGHEGGAPYSPIAHWHDASLHLAPEVRENHAMWMRICKHHMITCSELYILPLEGWRESRGVWMEVEFARSWGMPVSIIQNTTLAMQLGLELLDQEELDTLKWEVVE